MNGCVQAGQLELPNLLRATPREVVESSLACERAGARNPANRNETDGLIF